MIIIEEIIMNLIEKEELIKKVKKMKDSGKSIKEIALKIKQTEKEVKKYFRIIEIAEQRNIL